MSNITEFLKQKPDVIGPIELPPANNPSTAIDNSPALQWHLIRGKTIVTFVASEAGNAVAMIKDRQLTMSYEDAVAITRYIGLPPGFVQPTGQ